MQTIDVVLSSDEKFLPYTAVTIASLLTNLSDNRSLRIFLLTDKPMPVEHRRRFTALTKIRDFSLIEIPVDASQFGSIRTTANISVATYYRLLMHELLPADVSKVLYLDSDLTIRKSVGELFDTNMEGFLFAGVEDSRSKDYASKFGMPPGSPHINAGVAVVNVAGLRASNFSQRVSQYIAVNRYKIMLGDQQIICCSSPDDIRYVPVRWNVHGPMFQKDWASKNAGVLNGHSAEAIEAAVKDPSIVHFTLHNRKPWNSLEHPRAAEWWSYAALTEYGALLQKPSSPADAKKPSASQPAKTATKASVAAPKKQRKTPRPLIYIWSYLKSIALLRSTRLRVDKLQKEIAKIIAGAPKSTANHGGLVLKSGAIATSQMPYIHLSAMQHNILRNRAERLSSRPFNASVFLDSLQENSRALTNGENWDLDGGYHENIKTLLRTSNISRTLDVSEVDLVVLMVIRLKYDIFWQCVYLAEQYDLPMVFVEGAFFGGFGGYFDESMKGIERQSFGFMLDDISYYFDARHPSRLELMLNSDRELSTAEIARSKKLIQRVISERLTKYNAYAAVPLAPQIEPGCILVIDQKVADASLEFAAVTPQTLDRMLETALAENPGKRVYFKPHPDNRGKDRSVDSRALILPENVDITVALDACEAVYTATSQVGFEALLRGKRVEVFGRPFYAGWGLTNDRQKIARRQRARSVEDIFHMACIDLSVYIDPRTGSRIELEGAFDLVRDLREARSR